MSVTRDSLSVSLSPPVSSSAAPPGLAAASASAADAPVVVIGAGPVGLRFAAEFLSHSAERSVKVFGEEAREPYNRVKLSSWLAGELGAEGLTLASDLSDHPRFELATGERIVAIDCAARCVLGASGLRQPYSDLVLATGSRAHRPAIGGVDLAGVFTFRDLADAEKLSARRVRTRHTVVIGGGLLGLEAARGMLRHQTAVTVLDHGPRLMARQLDDEASARLQAFAEASHIAVLLDAQTAAIEGNERVEAVRLRDGRLLPCDTVIIATGIVPCTELALEAHIAVGRGIRVDDEMRTNRAHVYAIGDCAEHREVVYGLVAPGYEQAAVAAHVIAGRYARYNGSTRATRLKVMGLPVSSIGRVGDARPLRARTHGYSAGDGYRAIVVEHGQLVGAVGVGEWPESSRIQEAVVRRRRIWPWQVLRFRREGRLWPEQEAGSVLLWPASAVVCNCTGVTRGTLATHLRAGPCSVEALSAATGAGTVCGSCKCHLAELCGGGARLSPEVDARTLAVAGSLAAATTTAFLLPVDVPYPAVIDNGLPRWDLLWRDSFTKQVTGFVSGGLGLILASLSLRKRVPWLSRVARYTSWRQLHALLGLLMLLALVVHTGGRLGANLNLWLSLSMLMAIAAGTVAAGATALAHVPLQPLARQRRSSQKWHRIALWPVPVLLVFHVLKTYWY